MIVHWFGHAAFSIASTTAPPMRLCIDPHAPGVLGGRFQLPPIDGPFDAVLTTHRHEDHAAWRPALGTTQMVDTNQQLGSLTIAFRGVPHDTDQGVQMGWVRMASISDGHHRIVHAGDIGSYTDADLAWLSGVDVLLVPVGGTYTLDGAGAAELTRLIRPRWVVPMHGADPAIDLPLAPVQDFLNALAWPVHTASHLDLRSPPAPGSAVLLTRPESKST